MELLANIKKNVHTYMLICGVIYLSINTDIKDGNLPFYNHPTIVLIADISLRVGDCALKAKYRRLCCIGKCCQSEMFRCWLSTIQWSDRWPWKRKTAITIIGVTLGGLAVYLKITKVAKQSYKHLIRYSFYIYFNSVFVWSSTLNGTV